ncbi:hypothetical protein [Streptococcus sp. zg-JUN1979]|uniref:hypothetical protein n=1 Tax=Streptococcus sp. zg-JUN1979 TaxID=3391450 RepID=UPI0039A465EB
MIIDIKSILKKTGIGITTGVVIVSVATTIYTFNEMYQVGRNYDTHLTAKQALDVSNRNYNLVFYKKSCPYCQAAKQDVIKAGQKSDITTFYIDVNSKEGQRLVSTYQLDHAYTLVIVRGDKVEKNLYALEVDNSIRANNKVIKKLYH